MSPQEGHASGAPGGDDALRWASPFSEEITEFVDPLGLFLFRGGGTGGAGGRYEEAGWGGRWGRGCKAVG